MASSPISWACQSCRANPQTLVLGIYGKLCESCFQREKTALGIYGKAEYAADKDPKFPGNGRATER